MSKGKKIYTPNVIFVNKNYKKPVETANKTLFFYLINKYFANRWIIAMFLIKLINFLKLFFKNAKYFLRIFAVYLDKYFLKLYLL